MIDQQLQQIIDRLDRQSQELTQLRRELAEMKKHFSSATVREAYSIDQAAERLGRAPWTVRQWCNKKQVQGAERVHGRGRRDEWRIPHEVLLRLEKEGPLPLNQTAA